MNRRDFLKLALMSSALLVPASLPTFAAPAFAAATAPLDTATVAIPRSLMLHSRHHKQFPDLLDYLMDQGYVGITYDTFYRALQGEIRLPEKPFLLTIDDLSMTKGVPSFKVFASMHQALIERGFKANYAIITRPDLPQDDDLWAEVKTWGEDGYGLENHTSYHSNLDNPKWIAEDYRAEIVSSAAEIRHRTGQPVHALITPFGSGYDTTTGTLLPMVSAACKQGDLSFAVGIVGGRTPIQRPIQQRGVYYLGRCTMGIDDTNASGIWEVEHWI
ncbi:MAG TPA: polysaccharide deacetylase family protein [Phototrophicaceae bacterium]|jgi:hypothetical protein|nr:polysaccharide deacetylase family protein [Phototrophicaceae bacterium]